jgi:hypothetical protein
MNEGINLLEPNKKTTSAGFVRRIHIMRLIVVSLLFVVSVSSVILFILVALSPLPTLRQQEQTLEQNLSASKSDVVKLDLIKDRSASVSQFLAKRQDLSQLISVIQSKLTGDATVAAIQSSGGDLTVTVQSSSLEDLDNCLNGLIVLVQQKKVFSQVTMVDLANNQVDNQYEVTLDLKPM